MIRVFMLVGLAALVSTCQPQNQSGLSKKPSAGEPATIVRYMSAVALPPTKPPLEDLSDNSDAPLKPTKSPPARPNRTDADTGRHQAPRATDVSEASPEVRDRPPLPVPKPDIVDPPTVPNHSAKAEHLPMPIASCQISSNIALETYKTYVTGNAGAVDLSATNPLLAATYHRFTDAILDCGPFAAYRIRLELGAGLLAFFSEEYEKALRHGRALGSALEQPYYRLAAEFFTTLQFCIRHEKLVAVWRRAELLQIRGFAKAAAKHFEDLSGNKECSPLASFSYYRLQVGPRLQDPIGRSH